MQVASSARPKGCESFPISSLMSLMSPASRLVLSMYRSKWEESSSVVLQHGHSFCAGSATFARWWLRIPSGSRS